MRVSGKKGSKSFVIVVILYSVLFYCVLSNSRIGHVQFVGFKFNNKTYTIKYTIILGGIELCRCMPQFSFYYFCTNAYGHNKQNGKCSANGDTIYQGVRIYQYYARNFRN